MFLCGAISNICFVRNHINDKIVLKLGMVVNTLLINETIHVLYQCNLHNRLVYGNIEIPYGNIFSRLTLNFVSK